MEREAPQLSEARIALYAILADLCGVDESIDEQSTDEHSTDDEHSMDDEHSTDEYSTNEHFADEELLNESSCVEIQEVRWMRASYIQIKHLRWMEHTLILLPEYQRLCLTSFTRRFRRIDPPGSSGYVPAKVIIPFRLIHALSEYRQEFSGIQDKVRDAAKQALGIGI
ncbi:uncharacterized protein BDV14DRAFT_185832 [Aspergillus stella-maris]|uniref:uncharacterized protein n=1 Tax=Aspergillus stella-maris TaxID=1810926 RepID=UPI003CCE4F60